MTHTRLVLPELQSCLVPELSLVHIVCVSCGDIISIPAVDLLRLSQESLKNGGCSDAK